MNRRKLFAAVLTLALLVTGLCACGEAPAESRKAETVSGEAQTSAVQSEASSAGTQTSAAQTEAPSVETEASAAQTETSSAEPAATEKAAEGETMIYAHIGEKTLAIKPENNSSAEAFIELLWRGDVTVDMHDYGSFEKVGPLGTSLPTNDERITTEPGDVILYQGNQITIYYAPNTWSFTRLGRVQGLSPEELKAALGGDGCTVVFSLEESKGASAEVGVFDFETRTVLLNSGYTMPILGLGTYSLDHETCVNSVKALLKNGGRLIDTAYMYHNEEAVGEGVRQGSGADKRGIEDICAEELCAGILCVLRTQVSAPRAELLKAAAKQFGFARMNPAIEAAMGGALELAVSCGKAKLEEEQVVLAE